MVMFPHFLDGILYYMYTKNNYYDDQKVINKCVKRIGTYFCVKLILFNTVNS